MGIHTDQLKAGDLIINANRIIVFLAPKTEKTFYAYYICNCTKEELKYNGALLYSYVKAIIEDMLTKAAQPERILTTVVKSTTNNNNITPVSKMFKFYDAEIFKKWYTKSMLCKESLVGLCDMQSLMEEKRLGGKILAGETKTKGIYRTKKGAVYMVRCFRNQIKFVSIPSQFLEQVLKGDYKDFNEYVSNMDHYERKYRWYWETYTLYSTGYEITDEELDFLTKTYDYK